MTDVMHDQPRTIAVARTANPVLPSQRTGDDRPRDPHGAPARILIIDTERRHVQPLADSLQPDFAVTIATTIDQAGTVPVGELAIVSLRLGPAADRLVTALRRGGWARVLALAAPSDQELAGRTMAGGATGLVIVPLQQGASPHPQSVVPDLTDREVEVIAMVADGRSNKWIGEQLGLSALTVKSHLARIGRKLGTGDRAEIVHLALRAGVIQ